MGSHYGVKIRKRMREVLEVQRSEFTCPTCGKPKVVRRGLALWECKACGVKIAGGAYAMETPVGAAARKTLVSTLQPAV